MSKYTERALLRRRQMRPDGRPVYNCCQTVACCFAEELGYDEDAAMNRDDLISAVLDSLKLDD